MSDQGDPGRPRPVAYAKEIVASQVSRLVTIALQFLTAPLVAAAVGPTSYGLVGFHLTLVAFLTFLTQGPSSIATRILSPWSTLDPKAQRQIKAVHVALELLAAGIGLSASLCLLLAAPWIVTDWLSVPSELRIDAELIVALMALNLAAQWLHPFYTASFSALHAQHVLAVPLSLFSLAQNGGVLALLYFVAPRLELFFAWNAATWALFNWYSHGRLLALLPGERISIRDAIGTLREHVTFGLSVTAFALLNSLLAQLDKLVVSYAASLADMAAYVMSFTMASPILALAATPVGAVLLPIITRHAALETDRGLAHEYHRWTQALMILALPPTATLIAFPYQIAEFWLGSGSPLVPHIAQILPWSAAGVFCLALSTPPLLLQWGHGWISLSVIKIIAVLPLYLTALLVTVPRYGPVAGAWCHLAAQLVILVVEVPVTHAYLLRTELVRWLTLSVLAPILATLAIFGLAGPLLSSAFGGLGLIVAATILAIVHAAALTALMPLTRPFLARLVARARALTMRH